MFLPGASSFVTSRMRLAWRRGDDQAAVRIAQRFVRLRPGDPAGCHLLSRAVEESSRYAELEDAARRGLIRHPGDTRLRYSLGLALEGRTREGEDRSSEAEQTYESLMRDDPRSPLPYL